MLRDGLVLPPRLHQATLRLNAYWGCLKEDKSYGQTGRTARALQRA